MTPKQLARQVTAGKARYRQYVAQVLGLYGDDYDRAAQHLSGARRAWGFRSKRGITGAYVAEWAVRLGLKAEKE